MDNYKVYLGNVIYSQDKDTLVVKENLYIGSRWDCSRYL